MAGELVVQKLKHFNHFNVQRILKTGKNLSNFLQKVQFFPLYCSTNWHSCSSFGQRTEGTRKISLIIAQFVKQDHAVHGFSVLQFSNETDCDVDGSGYRWNLENQKVKSLKFKSLKN